MLRYRFFLFLSLIAGPLLLASSHILFSSSRRTSFNAEFQRLRDRLNKSQMGVFPFKLVLRYWILVHMCNIDEIDITWRAAIRRTNNLSSNYFVTWRARLTDFPSVHRLCTNGLTMDLANDVSRYAKWNECYCLSIGFFVVQSEDKNEKEKNENKRNNATAEVKTFFINTLHQASITKLSSSNKWSIRNVELLGSRSYIRICTFFLNREQEIILITQQNVLEDFLQRTKIFTNVLVAQSDHLA